MTMAPRRVIALLLCAVAGFAAAAAAAEGQCDAADGSCDANDEARPGDGSGKRAARQAACKDKERECGHWASLGECEKNPNYMLSE